MPKFLKNHKHRQADRQFPFLDSLKSEQILKPHSQDHNASILTVTSYKDHMGGKHKFLR